MIYFSLRRRIRLAFGFLTLPFTETFTVPRSHPYVLREVHANSPTLSPSSGSMSFRPPWIPEPAASNVHGPRSPSSHRRLGLRVCLYLTLLGLLLALSLELGGANPVRYVRFGMDALSRRHIAAPPPIQQTLSFYDPADLASVSPANPPDLSANARSVPIEAKPLPWAIPESVYFLYKGRRPGERSNDSRLRQRPVATAFVLSIPSHSHGRYVRFLVTARHVVDPQWAHCSVRNPDSIDVRLNRRSGGVDYETVALHSGTNRNFYTPSDTTTDLAVIPLDQTLIHNIEDYKFIDVPFRLLPTDAEVRLIGADQPVMTAGLSPQPSDESGGYPVFDAGSLSNMPTEPVGVQCGTPQSPQMPAKLLHVWFINAGAPQGVSGAPVYTSLARGVASVKSPVLLGIQSVAWPDKGVAGITPSAALGDLIQSALRKKKLNLDLYRGPNP